MSLQLFLIYLATWSLIAITPGPAVMCAMAQSTRFGFRTSLAGIIGIQSGNLLFFVSVALGLAALLATATTAFTVLRLAGAVYLFYLGARVILATFHRPTVCKPGATGASPAWRGLFLQGLLIQLTNPKALLFVSALLPQFIEARRPLLLQLVILSAATVVVDTVVLSSYACFAGHGAATFRASRFCGWLERAFGAALIGFGLRVLISRK